MIKIICIAIISLLLISSAIFYKTLIREFKDYQSIQTSKKRAKYYFVKNGEKFKDITQVLINDSSVPVELKDELITGKRKIVVFKYLSDSDPVAGYLSYLQKVFIPP